jgi:hypothetical protein
VTLSDGSCLSRDKDYSSAKVRDALKDDAAVLAIKEGFKDKDCKVVMKPAEDLSDEEIKGLVAYVGSLKKWQACRGKVAQSRDSLLPFDCIRCVLRRLCIPRACIFIFLVVPSIAKKACWR